MGLEIALSHMHLFGEVNDSAHSILIQTVYNSVSYGLLSDLYTDIWTIHTVTIFSKCHLNCKTVLLLSVFQNLLQGTK